MSDDRDQLLAKAERWIRRGELADAQAVLQQLALAHPDDARIAARLRAVQALADPAAQPRRTPSPDLSPEQRAEALVEDGDLRGAVAVYQALVAKRPGHALARERLAELRKLGNLAAPDPEPPQDPAQTLSGLLARIQANRRK